MFSGCGMRKAAVCTALLTLLLVARVMGASVEMPSATNFKFKSPDWGGNVAGTKIDWGTFDTYKKNCIEMKSTYKFWLESFNFLYCGWSYGTSPSEATFTIDNAWAAGDGISLLRILNQGNSKFTVFGSGRVVTSEDPSFHEYDMFPWDDKLIVDGNTRLYGMLDLSQAPYQYDGACNGLIRPRKYTCSELSDLAYYGGVYDGDLAYCSEADSQYGEMQYGNGAWVVYDSTNSCWHVIKLFY